MDSSPNAPAAPPAAAAPAAGAGPAAPEEVLIKLQGKGLPFQLNPNQLKRKADATIGEVQNLVSSRLLNRRQNLVSSVVHVFITRGSECFIPSPDQTVGNLVALYGQDDFVEKARVLTLTVSTQIFQG